MGVVRMLCQKYGVVVKTISQKPALLRGGQFKIWAFGVLGDKSIVVHRLRGKFAFGGIEKSWFAGYGGMRMWYMV